MALLQRTEAQLRAELADVVLNISNGQGQAARLEADRELANRYRAVVQSSALHVGSLGFLLGWLNAANFGPTVTEAVFSSAEGTAVVGNFLTLLKSRTAAWEQFCRAVLGTDPVATSRLNGSTSQALAEFDTKLASAPLDFDECKAHMALLLHWHSQALALPGESPVAVGTTTFYPRDTINTINFPVNLPGSERFTGSTMTQQKGTGQ